MAKRPNVLLIITDQHRADHLGCYGNPVVRTPNIDGLASNGIRFIRNYVASPVCMPNRASIMTCRMPSLHGVRHNGIDLSRDSTTFVDLLREAGYRTALIGKSHLQNFSGLPPALTWKEEFGLRHPSPRLREASKRLRSGPGYSLEFSRNWREARGYSIQEPYYGFDTVRLATDHADQCGGDYYVWLSERHPDPESLRGPRNAIPDDRYCAPQAWRTRVPDELYPTSFVVDETIKWLRDHAGQSDRKPFFVQISFPDPHHPFTPPGRYWDMYDPASIELPKSFAKGDLPPIQTLKQALNQGTANRTSHDPFVVTERECREIIALTYGMITMVDDAIGRTLACLRELDLERDTIVIFTADHGDYMGDHGLMLKMLLHYQGLIRIPLIWRDIDGTGGVTDDSLASSLDLGVTVLKRCGIQPFNGAQGRNLLDKGTPPPAGLIIEEDAQRAMAGSDRLPRLRTFLNKQWRMSLRNGESWGELYDLENDPLENVNLWEHPAYDKVRGQLFAAALERIVELQDRSPLPTSRA